MCQGLSYNLTSFPNIWLSISDQRQAATLLQQYRVSPPYPYPCYHSKRFEICMLIQT